MAKSFKVALAGVKELDKELKAIAESEGPKSVNKEMRSATREAVRNLVLPQVRANIPFETGFLESQITVKSIKRSRVKMGSAVGFKNDLFKGDTFYAGFLEYGFMHRSGTPVMGDSFLRRPLYQNESRVRAHIVGRLRRWLAARNR